MSDNGMPRAERNRLLTAGILSLVGIVGFSGESAAQHRDVLVAARDGRLVAGTYDWGSGKAELPVRVLKNVFEWAEEDFAASSNPGFNSMVDPPGDSEPLPAAAELSFRMHSFGSELHGNFWHWSGRDPVRFEPVDGGESFRFVARDGSKTARVTGADRSVEGFLIAETLDGGVLHEHFTLLLLGPDSDDAGTSETPPSEGVYAVALSFSMPGFEASTESYLLLAHGEAPASRLDAAAQWVHDHWVPDCSDGLDNDLDGLVDFPDDPDCESEQSWCEPPSCRPTEATATRDVDAGLVSADTPAAPSQAEAQDGGCSMSPASSGSSAGRLATGPAWSALCAAFIWRSRRRRRGTWVLPLTLALVLVAWRANAEDCTGERDFGKGLVDHSCFHTEHGPFVDVTATVGREPTAATPDISAVHTYFRVTITPHEPNLVTYHANRAGTWVLFGGLEAPQRVFTENGEELQALMEVALDDCGGLPLARVFELEASTTYHIVLGPADADQTFIELEKISDFETLYGLDMDGDGYGSRTETVRTPCLPPDGYVPDATDCDDTDEQIHPGATESCDDVDRNCNGSPTDGFDVGESCSVGVGACEVNGTLVCADGGESAWCPVEPEEPARESCDGVDDDCDGVPDEDEELCEDAPSGTRCVTVEGDTHCGCRSDHDCTVGQRCDPRDGRCVASDGDGCECRSVGRRPKGAASGFGWWCSVCALVLLWRARSRGRALVR